MYPKSWDAFASQAEELYRKDPLGTRYLMKYRHSDGKLILKCLKFQTDQQSELQNIEKFNNRFFALMARGIDGADAMDPKEMEAPAQPATPQQPKGRKHRRRG